MTAILDATEVLLLEVGIGRLTTNRIAKRAGVSVGSLYQYFENKESIVAQVGRRFDVRRLARMRRALATSSTAPVETLLRAAAEHELEHGRTRALLAREVPASWIQADRATVRWLSWVIARYLPERARPDVIAFVAYHGVVSTLEAVAREEPERLTSARLLGELERLLRPLVYG